MKLYIFRKIIIAFIILTPAVSYSGCKKQAKCGCDGDLLFTLPEYNQLFNYSDIYYMDSTSASFQLGIYERYNFCNPTEMYPVYKALKGKNQIILTGDVYWNCNYLMNSSSSSYYYQYYKIYDIRVTGMTYQPFGKK